MAFGTIVTLELGPNRRFSEVAWLGFRWAGDAVIDGRPSGVLDLGVVNADVADSSVFSSSSSSSRNDSFPFPTCFRFFGGGCGVETLCFDDQSLLVINLVPCNKIDNLQQGTYPLLGVAVPDVDIVPKRPYLTAWASRPFCSSASARRLRKSDKWTRPTV